MGLTIIFLVFFVLRSGIPRTLEAFLEVNYFSLIPAFICYAIALMWRTIRGKVVLQPIGEFHFSTLWKGVIIGYSANNLLPIRLGDLVRSHYLGHTSGFNKTSIFATIVIERVFDGLGLLFLMGLFSIFLPTAGLLRAVGQEAYIDPLVLTTILIIPFVAAITFLGMAAAFPQAVKRILIMIFQLFPMSVETKLTRFFDLFLEGLLSLRDFEKTVSIFLLTLLVWISESGVFLSIAYGFQLDSFFPDWFLLAGVLVLTTAVANLATSIPSAGGGIGPFEFFAQSSLIFFGMDVSLASAYILVVHALLLFPVTILGLIYMWIGKSLFRETFWLRSFEALEQTLRDLKLQTHCSFGRWYPFGYYCLLGAHPDSNVRWCCCRGNADVRSGLAES